MPTKGQQQKIDFTVSRDNLYREESFTDIKVAAIRKLTPIKPDGTEDGRRGPIFMGQSQLLTPDGPVMLQSILQANNLEEAMDKFPAAMQSEMDKMINEIQQKKAAESS